MLPGVVIRPGRHAPPRLTNLLERLPASAPPLAKIESIQHTVLTPATIPQASFTITPSRAGHSRTQISPDAATCPQCLAETLNPASRFLPLSFTNCHPLRPPASASFAPSPTTGAITSMAGFPNVPYLPGRVTAIPSTAASTPSRWPAIRCGPQVWLESAQGGM